MSRDFGIYQSVEATPAVDLSRLDNVLVVTSTELESGAVPPRGNHGSSRSCGRYEEIRSAVRPVRPLLGAGLAPPSPALPRRSHCLSSSSWACTNSLSRGAALACVLGYGLDLLAAAPVGLFTFVFVATFVLARAAGVRLAAQHIITQVPLAFVFSVLQSVMVLVLLAIFGRNPHGARDMLSLVLPHAIATAVFSPITFGLAARMHAATGTTPHAGGRGA